MGRRNFQYFVREGLNNMFSHGFMTFAAVSITVACLLIMGTCSLVALNASANLKDLEDSNEIVAFVDERYTPEEAKALGEKLSALPHVTAAVFISRQEAMDSFRSAASTISSTGKSSLLFQIWFSSWIRQ